LSETNNSRSTNEYVLVTGANRNIGAHLAHRFLDDGYGVVAHYRSTSDAISALAQRGAILIQGEFHDTQSCLAIARRIDDIAGALRAIVHNASAFGPTREEPEAAGSQFQAFFDVHMRAPYLLNTRLAPQMQASAEAPGDIIHITDIYADNPGPEYDIYCATKAGLQNLALSFAKQLAPRIKVNVVQPGPISFEEWHSDASMDEVLKSTLLERMGTPEAIYKAIRAVMDNDFQTGAVIAVDGGRRLGR